MISQIGILRKIRANFSSFEDVLLFTQIFLLITVLPPMLKLLSIPRLMKLLTPWDLETHKKLDLERSKEKVAKFTDYILGLNFWIYKSTCLKRSLVLYHFLHKLGINVHLCFGVKYSKELTDRETKKKLEGHAWLVYNGSIFLERNIEVAKAYKMTCCFPEEKEQIAQETILKLS